ncbi:MAG: hypothetical protein ACRD72_11360 [Candidatus Angelobacter sp.]|jgi:hypothetical protein
MDELTKSGVERIEAPGYVSAADLLTASNISLREKLAIGLLVLFAAAVTSTYTLIFLWGFQKIHLPGPFVHWLGGATIGQTASLLVLVVRDLFPAKVARAPTTKKTS